MTYLKIIPEVVSDTIVNDSLGYSKRKRLDAMLNIMKHDMSNNNIVHINNVTNAVMKERPFPYSLEEMEHLQAILLADKYIEKMSNPMYFTIMPITFKFEGYINQYSSIFWRKILTAIWHLLVSIIVPLAVAYFTVTLTLDK